MNISTSHLLRMVSKIRCHRDKSRQLDHLLMHPDDLRSVADDEMLSTNFCILDLRIRTSEYAQRGKIIKVFVTE